MKISGEENNIVIGNGDEDSALKLNSDDWEVKLNDQGDEFSFENDGNNYQVYTSTDSGDEYNLIINDMIDVII